MLPVSSICQLNEETVVLSTNHQARLFRFSGSAHIHVVSSATAFVTLSGGMRRSKVLARSGCNVQNDYETPRDEFSVRAGIGDSCIAQYRASAANEVAFVEYEGWSQARMIHHCGTRVTDRHEM